MPAVPLTLAFRIWRHCSRAAQNASAAGQLYGALRTVSMLSCRMISSTSFSGCLAAFTHVLEASTSVCSVSTSRIPPRRSAASFWASSS